MVVVRKIVVILLLLPILHALGFWYATANKTELVVDSATGALVQRPVETPFWSSYRTYLQQLVEGNTPRIQGQTITKLLTEPVRRSLVLMGCAFLVTLLLGPLLGLLAISSQTGRARTRLQVFYTTAASIPGFFAATLCITLLLYAARYGIANGKQTLIPIQGTGYGAHLIIPTIALAFRPTFFIAALTSSMVEQELQLDYIRVAKSKGLPWAMILWRHAIPNAMSQLLTGLGQTVRLLASTLILVETVIDWRGMGRMLMQIVATGQRSNSSYAFNAPLLSTLLLLFGLLLLLADLITTVVSNVADPRLREEGA